MNHNLLGSANEAHFLVDDAGRAHLDRVLRGQNLSQVLANAGYDSQSLVEGLQQMISTAEAQGRVSADEAGALAEFYQSTLDAYTYLED